MNEQKLKQWLQASDVTATEPVLPPLDADHLERLVSHRRVRRRGFTAAGISTAGVLVALLATSADRPRTRIASPPEATGFIAADEEPRVADRKKSLAQLAALEQQIDERKALVAVLRQADDLERLNRELAELQEQVPASVAHAPIRMEQARNEAAAVSLHYAHALAHEFGERDLAAAEYKAVASRYPETTWSTAAEQALRTADPSS